MWVGDGTWSELSLLQPHEVESVHELQPKKLQSVEEVSVEEGHLRGVLLSWDPGTRVGDVQVLKEFPLEGFQTPVLRVTVFGVFLGVSSGPCPIVTQPT